MQKMKTTLIIMLVFALVFSISPVKGETCYVALRELLSSKDQENFYLGKGRSTSAEASKDIYAVYVEKDESFYIVGVNEFNKGEITIWKNIDMLNGYRMIYTLSSIWPALQENIDPGYSITLAITDMEMIEGDWVIDDKKSADSFVKVIEQTFAAVSGK